MSGLFFAKAMFVLAFMVTLPFAHQGIYDGYDAYNEREVGMDQRTRGLIMWNLYEPGNGSPAFEDEGATERAKYLDGWVDNWVPEPSGPPPIVVGMITGAMNLYDRVAWFGYRNRGWLSPTIIDTFYVTVQAAFLAGWTFRYRRELRHVARRVRHR